MVIFGGLEIVAGGYLIHRYHKKQNEKKRLEDEAQQRRHNTFPGAQQPKPYYPPAHPHHPPAPAPQQKYTYHSPQPRPQVPFPPQHRFTEPLPQNPYNATQFNHAQPHMIPRRPVPQQQPPPIIIQPLQRADSMATLSRMPMANGYRPGRAENEPPLPPRRQTSTLSPVPQSPSPYGHSGFAVSSPALGHTAVTPTHHTAQTGGWQSVDDNWETYTQPHGHAHYAPSVSTALGEQVDDDPPPPYRP